MTTLSGVQPEDNVIAQTCVVLVTEIDKDSTTEMIEHLGNVGACEIMTEILTNIKHHQSPATIITPILQVITRLSKLERNREKLAANGMYELVLDILPLFRNSETVSRPALQLVGNLAFCDSPIVKVALPRAAGEVAETLKSLGGKHNVEFTLLGCQVLGHVVDKLGGIVDHHRDIAVAVLVDILRTMGPENSQIAHVTCFALSILVQAPDQAVDLERTDAFVPILMALQTWGNNDVRIAEPALLVLWAMTERDSINASNNQFMPTVLNIFQLYGKTNGRIAYYGSLLLVHALSPPTNEIQFMGVYEALIAILDVGGNVYIANAACLALDKLPKSVVPTKDETNIKSLTTLTRVLNAFGTQNHEIAFLAGVLLGDLWHRLVDVDLAYSFVQGTIEQALVATFRTFASVSAKGCYSVMGVLRLLAMRSNDIRATIIDLGTVECLITAVHTFGTEDKYFATRTMELVRMLARDPNSTTRLGLQGVISPVMDMLRHYGTRQDEVAAMTCAAVFNLSRTDKRNRREFIDNGAVVLVVKTLTSFGKTNGEVALWGCEVVRAFNKDEEEDSSLASRSALVRTQFGMAGVCVAIVDVARAFQTQLDVMVAVCCAIWVIARHDVRNSRALGAAGAIELMVDLLQHAGLSHAEVQSQLIGSLVPRDELVARSVCLAIESLACDEGNRVKLRALGMVELLMKCCEVYAVLGKEAVVNDVRRMIVVIDDA